MVLKPLAPTLHASLSTCLMQLDTKDQELSKVSEQLVAITSRTSTTEADCSKLSEMVHSLESKLTMAHQELTALRAQLQVRDELGVEPHMNMVCDKWHHGDGTRGTNDHTASC